MKEGSIFPTSTTNQTTNSTEPTQTLNDQSPKDKTEASLTTDLKTTNGPQNTEITIHSNSTSTFYNFSSTAKPKYVLNKEQILMICGVIIFGLVVLPVVLLSIEKCKCKRSKTIAIYNHNFTEKSQQFFSSTHLNESYCE